MFAIVKKYRRKTLYKTKKDSKMRFTRKRVTILKMGSSRDEIYSSEVMILCILLLICMFVLFCKMSFDLMEFSTFTTGLTKEAKIIEIDES